MMDAFALREQAEWEVAAVNRAITKYHEAKRHMATHELPPGAQALVETVGPVSEVIAKKQKEFGGPAQPGPAALWKFAFLLSPPDVLSAVGIITALRTSTTPGGRVGVSVMQYSRWVASVLKDQHDHDFWVADLEAKQRAAVRDAKAAGKAPNEVREDALVRRFRKQFPDGDRKGWAKFAGKMEIARSSKWSGEMTTQVGACLAQCLADGAPEWFEVIRSGVGHAHLWPLCLCLTPRAVERMADMDVRAEVARPMLLPMIIPPIPWKYEEKDLAA